MEVKLPAARYIILSWFSLQDSVKVNVVIPVYNAHDVIRETIETVLAQTWKE